MNVQGHMQGLENEECEGAINIYIYKQIGPNILKPNALF